MDIASVIFGFMIATLVWWPAILNDLRRIARSDKYVGPPTGG